MQELINKIKEAAGIDDAQAKKAIETVSEYLKNKMPKPFHPQIDNLINGGKLSEGIKEQLMDAAVDAKEKTEDVLKDLTEKMEAFAKELRKKWDEKKSENKS